MNVSLAASLALALSGCAIFSPYGGTFMCSATDDYGRCVNLAEAAGYSGPYTLIFDSEVPVNEWDGLALERDFIVSRVSGA